MSLSELSSEMVSFLPLFLKCQFEISDDPLKVADPLLAGGMNILSLNSPHGAAFRSESGSEDLSMNELHVNLPEMGPVEAIGKFPARRVDVIPHFGINFADDGQIAT
jgi:hypothetical protein